MIIINVDKFSWLNAHYISSFTARIQSPLKYALQPYLSHLTANSDICLCLNTYILMIERTSNLLLNCLFHHLSWICTNIRYILTHVCSDGIVTSCLYQVAIVLVVHFNFQPTITTSQTYLSWAVTMLHEYYTSCQLFLSANTYLQIALLYSCYKCYHFIWYLELAKSSLFLSLLSCYMSFSSSSLLSICRPI